MDQQPQVTIGSEFNVINEFVDADGVSIRRVDCFDMSNVSPSREFIRTRIGEYVEAVSRNPHWEPPRVVIEESGEKQLILNNEVALAMYSEMPAMKSWRMELVPGAVALYPLQYPEEVRLPNGFEIDELSRSMFTDSLDAIGIRTRAVVMSHIAAKYINDGVTNWASLACGAAVPVLNAIQRNRVAPGQVKLRLADYDPEALEFAGQLAKSRNLVEGHDFELMKRNLLRDLIATSRLVDELGECSMDFVDTLGIFEYFTDEQSVRFLANSYKLVRPGGALVLANMLDTHPEILFNQRVIGWPTIYPRSIETIKSIVQIAGIPLERVSITIPGDQIYAVLEVWK